ncbi:alpha/beta hydrolase [Leucobacter massiliensis]|uniref:alpha/beta hydrolase n=1 Tax=Leucobacter massiliensis TaxID=1686285 RepID=UPI0015E31B3D|nr:alpha/beta hydrolase [Leucobacter massiliensis]
MKPTTHGERLSFYQFGATTMFASRMDQRFSYCLYVPESYDEQRPGRYSLVVAIHGTGRDAPRLRNEFIEFAEAEQCVVLVPLFPAGIGEPGELNAYKYLVGPDVRYDLVLLDMVAEVEETYRLSFETFFLTGFSGGAHFTHRFLYAHPERLFGVSIVSPGVVTLCDPELPWPAGVSGLESEFGRAFDADAVARVPTNLVVGDEDTETWEISVAPGSPAYIPGVNAAGVTRITRLDALADSLRRNGNAVTVDIVPGVAHEGYHLLKPTFRALRTLLREARGTEQETQVQS